MTDWSYLAQGEEKGNVGQGRSGGHQRSRQGCGQVDVVQPGGLRELPTITNTDSFPRTVLLLTSSPLPLLFPLPHMPFPFSLS